MDTHEKEYLAVVVNFFWGTGTATQASVNESVAKVVYKVLEETNACSKTMDAVPRPAYGALDIKYVVLQAVFAGKRIARGDGAVYQSCKGRAALNYKSELTMALMGIN